MKKYIGLFVVLAIALVLGSSSVRAEEARFGAGAMMGTPPTEQERIDALKKREEIRKQMQERIANMREEAKKKMQTLRDGIKNEKDTAKAKIKDLRLKGREVALERFDNALDRISKLKDRVNEMIDRLEPKDVDTTNAKNAVATVETKISDVKDKVAQMNTILGTSIDQLSAADKTKLRTLAKDTQALIVESHRLLREAIKSLRDQVKTKIEDKENEHAKENEDENDDNN